MILAGGHGVRLHPLTADRAKPSVPFGAKYRIIDFILNNMVNSGIYSIYLLTQFKAQSLTEHIQRYWRVGGFLRDHFIVLVPAQMFRFEELGAAWYRGTADAIYQNIHLIQDEKPQVVAVFGGDHVFKMNIADMVEYHLDNDADITIAACPVPIADASRMGVLQIDANWTLTEFAEKTADPKPIPGNPGSALASMGNYLFRCESLVELLEADAKDPASAHDFGKNVLPRALAAGYKIKVYNFHDNPIPGQHGPNTYWRDVGTIDAYFEASMDLVRVVPEFDLYNPEWPLRTANAFSPPAKFVHDTPERTGQALNSLVAGGAILSGGMVRESVLFRRVRVHSHASATRSVLFDNVKIGHHCELRNVIVDKDVVIPPHTRIGFDAAEDLRRGFTVTQSGIVVIGKGYVFGNE